MSFDEYTRQFDSIAFEVRHAFGMEVAMRSPRSMFRLVGITDTGPLSPRPWMRLFSRFTVGERERQRDRRRYR